MLVHSEHEDVRIDLNSTAESKAPTRNRPGPYGLFTSPTLSWKPI